jgi:diguanylate cyclase (GGDEF)-like protein/PAS domain S-box-containing protein
MRDTRSDGENVPAGEEAAKDQVTAATTDEDLAAVDRAGGKDPEADGADASGDDQLDAMLAALEQSHQEALVWAIDTDGLVAAVPESLNLHRQRLNRLALGELGLDVVVPECKFPLIEAWWQVQTEPHAQVHVRLAEDPNRLVTMDFFDARARHGVFIGVGTEADADKYETRLGDKLPELKARFSRVRKDEEAVLREIDEAFTQILGWSSEEVVGKRTLDLIHPDDRGLAVDNWVDMLFRGGMGRRVRLRHQHRSGSWVWLEVTNNNLLQDPKRACVIAELVDISDEMAAHEALRARERLLDRVAESVPVGLLQIDSDARVVFTNDRFHSMVGVDRVDDVYRQLATVIREDRGIMTEAFDSVLRNGVDAFIEVRVRRPKKRGNMTRYCSFNIRALTDDAGGVTGAMICLEDVTESVKAREELQALATFDAVTNCYNRTSTMSALTTMISSNDVRGRPAVIFVDLDRFKEVNDAFGHVAGDEFLRVVAARLQRGVRSEDVVGRIGGDEFLVLCPGVSSPAEAMRTAERLARSLRNPIFFSGSSAPSRASMGVAWSSALNMAAKKLVTQADAAMYASKRAGNGEPVLYDESMAQAKHTKRADGLAVSKKAC